MEARIIFIQSISKVNTFKNTLNHYPMKKRCLPYWATKELAERAKLKQSFYANRILSGNFWSWQQNFDLVFKSIPDLKRKVLENAKNDLTFADLLKMQPAIIAYL